MSRGKSWVGPFHYRTNGLCVKCEEVGAYKVTLKNWIVRVCRTHAIEALSSKEGGRTLAEAAREVDEEDAERLKIKNKRTLHWIPVSQRLPEWGERVLIVSACPNSSVPNIDTGGICNDGSFRDDHYEALDGVTHWMPLPEPPEVKL